MPYPSKDTHPLSESQETLVLAYAHLRRVAMNQVRAIEQAVSAEPPQALAHARCADKVLQAAQAVLAAARAADSAHPAPPKVTP